MHIIEIDQYRFYVDVIEYTPAVEGSYDYNASSDWDYYGSSEQVEWECEKASFIRCSGNEVILDDEQREEALKDFAELIEERLLRQIAEGVGI